MSNQLKSNDEIRKHLESKNIKYLIPSFVDMHGVPKTKMVPIAHLDKMMRGSEFFTGAALDGVPQDVSDEEVCAHPDPDSCMIVPWREDCAWFASDLWTEGSPFPACNRGILKRVLADAKSMGYTVNCGIEAEFYAFNDDDNQLDPMSSLPNLKKTA
jgi:glutamine synthetase